MGENETCRHCGKQPEADGDHTCTCPNPDDFCPDHPRPEDPWNTTDLNRLADD